MEPDLSIEHDWPKQLLTWMTDVNGNVSDVERLAGMSLNGVWRVRFRNASVIVKAGSSANEALFYKRVAPSLRASDVPIPDLYHLRHDPERHWLTIEDIPTPLLPPSSDDWQPDERIVAILSRLHATTRAKPPDLPAREPHGWSPESTMAALTCLKPDDAATVAPVLEQLHRESAASSEPWCWISGDPNPRNWGLREDGSPVLFDWELFGPGTPATDLAIIVPGLGDLAAYQRAATAYLAAWDAPEPLPWDTASLTRQIAVAKVATVVQLLDGHVGGSANVSDELVTWLADTFPGWVSSIHDAGLGRSGSS